MIIYVYDKYFRRIDILKKYTYCQVSDCARDIGTFSVNVVLDDDSKYLLNEKERYYLNFKETFDTVPVMGEVLKAKKDSEEDKQIIKLEGKMCINIFKYRIIEKTQSYSGKIKDIIGSIIYKNITSTVSLPNRINPRYIDIHVIKDVSSEYDMSVMVQKTGTDMLETMIDLCEQSEICLDFYPEIETLHKDIHLGDLYPETNISVWNLRIYSGKDRTRKNKDGNVPIVFSQSYSNIERTTYEVDKSDYINVAYVAGEGEGEQRQVEKVLESGFEENAMENVGFSRREMYVDARDLQKENNDGETITEEEYKQLLQQRGLEDLSEHIICLSYDGTAIIYNTKGQQRYKYGVDFYKGDKVEIVDNQLGVKVIAQITKVTRTYQKGENTIYDIEFGNKKYSIRKRLKRKGEK